VKARPPGYPGGVLELDQLDLEQIATALADQNGYKHRWLIDPQTGKIAFWTADTGIDGQNPVDPYDLDLVGIDPLPSWLWHQDMADFADRISDEKAGQRLERAIRDIRAQRRAVQWLTDNSLIDDEASARFLADHPDPELP
jgi:hypothetical protein